MAAGYFILIVNKIYPEYTFGYFFFMCIGIIGSFGRIYCWAHYFFDVIFGLMLSLIFNKLAIYLMGEFDDVLKLYFACLVLTGLGLLLLSKLLGLELDNK